MKPWMQLVIFKPPIVL